MEKNRYQLNSVIGSMKTWSGIDFSDVEPEIAQRIIDSGQTSSRGWFARLIFAKMLEIKPGGSFALGPIKAVDPFSEEELAMYAVRTARSQQRKAGWTDMAKKNNRRPAVLYHLEKTPEGTMVYIVRVPNE